jgi:hypothetical protein
MDGTADLVQENPMLNVVYQFSPCNLVKSNLPEVGPCILITVFRENGMKLFVGDVYVVKKGHCGDHLCPCVFFFFFFFIWFVRLLALRPLLAYCASLG